MANGVLVAPNMQSVFENVSVELIYSETDLTQNVIRQLKLDQWYLKVICCTKTAVFGEDLCVGFEDQKFMANADNWLDLIFDLNHTTDGAYILYVSGGGGLHKKVYYKDTLIFEYICDPAIICKGQRVVLYTPQYGWLA
jgi:hypothetical protein